MKIPLALLALLLIGAFVPVFALNVGPYPPGTTSISTTTGQCTTTLCSTTSPQKQTYNPATINGLRQDFGKFSFVTTLTNIQWNTTNADYLQFSPPTVGPTALSNSAIFFNSTETVWMMTTGLNTVQVFVKPGTYSANIFIQANFQSAQQVCLPFKAPSIIVQQSFINKTTQQTQLLPSVKSGNEIFSWSDIASSYSPTWGANKLCMSLPTGTTIIDPLAIDGTAGHVWTSGTSQNCALVTATGPDIIIVMVVGQPTQTLTSGQITVSDTSSLTWTSRAQLNDATTRDLVQWWYAKASGAITDSITLTITRLATAMNNGLISCFGVSGADQTTIFDTNGAIPGTHADDSGATHPSVTISTSNANDFIFGSALAQGGAGLSSPSGYSTIANAICGSFSCDASYKIVSATISSVAQTWGGDIDNNIAGVDAIMQATATVTQGIQITTAGGAPQATITISGCSPSNSTFTADGFTHTYTLTPSCIVSLTVPADATNTRYRWNGSPHPTEIKTAKFTTCPGPGTCTLYQNTTWYELHNIFEVTPQTPNIWDGTYSTNLVGEIVGASPTNTCAGGTIATLEDNGGALDICPSGNWADYGTGVTVEGLFFANRIGNTWFAQLPNTFVDTTGGNTHNVNYVQSVGGGSYSLNWLLLIPIVMLVVIVFAVKKR